MYAKGQVTLSRPRSDIVGFCWLIYLWRGFICLWKQRTFWRKGQKDKVNESLRDFDWCRSIRLSDHWRYWHEDSLKALVQSKNLWNIWTIAYRDGNKVSENWNNISSDEWSQAYSCLLDSIPVCYKLDSGIRHDLWWISWLFRSANHDIMQPKRWICRANLIQYRFAWLLYWERNQCCSIQLPWIWSEPRYSKH